MASLQKSLTSKQQSLLSLQKQKLKLQAEAQRWYGIVALPLAIAFGIASGVSPEKGLITAIIGGFLCSFFGGSSVQISGPTGAFIVIVYGIIQTFGLEGLLVATAIAGVLLVIMGLLRLGTVIRYIPYPIIIGFTSGIALTIFTTQVEDLLGLKITESSGDFLGKWASYFDAIHTISWSSLAVGLLTILIIVYLPRINRRLPGSLVAIVVVTVVSYVLREFCGYTALETIGDRFTISPEIPSPTALEMNFTTIRLLLPSALTIALLGAIESLLSATVADGVTGERHNSNTELLGQGIANIVSPLFGGIPVTGAIARTMTNINNGGRTPISGIIHALVLLLILLFLSPLTKHIPMAALAGVLVVVCYNMSEWRTVRSLLKNPKNDVAVLITTLLLTVVFDLTIAIFVGLLMAMVLFLKRVSEATNISVSTQSLDLGAEGEITSADHVLEVPSGVEVYEIDGPFFFGVAQKFESVVKRLSDKPKVRIIRMRRVSFMDSTGIYNLRSLVKSSHSDGITVILSGVSPSVRETLAKAGFHSTLEQGFICDDISQALTLAPKYI